MKRQPPSKPASAKKVSPNAGREKRRGETVSKQETATSPYERVFPGPEPSRSTLALLAAVVSIGTQKTPLEAIGQAYQLWNAADERLRGLAESKETFDSDPIIAQIRWPDAKEPLTLDAFLTLNVTGGNAGERMAFLRRCYSSWGGSSDEQKESGIQRLMDKGLTELEWNSLAEHCRRRQEFERAETNCKNAEQTATVRKNLRAAEDFKAGWPSKSAQEQLNAREQPPEWVSFLSGYAARWKKRSSSERRPMSVKPAAELVKWWKEQLPTSE